MKWTCGLELGSEDLFACQSELSMKMTRISTLRASSEPNVPKTSQDFVHTVINVIPLLGIGVAVCSACGHSGVTPSE